MHFLYIDTPKVVEKIANFLTDAGAKDVGECVYGNFRASAASATEDHNTTLWSLR